jgi:hypothetical protein
MPLIDGVYFSDDEYRDAFGAPGPGRDDFAERGYRDNYDSVQDVPGYDYGSSSYVDGGGGAGSVYPQQPDESHQAYVDRLTRQGAGHLINPDGTQYATIGEGNSLTQAQADAYASGAAESGIPQEWIDDFLQRNPGDYSRLESAYNSHGGDDAAPGLPFAVPGMPTGNAPFDPFGAPNARAQGYPDYTPTTGADVLADPGFKFRFDEGVKALERSGAAKGTLFTQTPQATQEFGQGLASTEFGNVDARRYRDWLSGYSRVASEDDDEFNRAYQVWTGNTQGQRQANLDQFSMADINRRFGLDANNQSFTQNRASYLDDFNIFNTLDTNYWDRLYQGAALGRP